MKRAVVSVATGLLLGIALCLLPAGAAAQVSVPPTLTGEVFHSNDPVITSTICLPNLLSGSFDATGFATGPYPGRFHEAASASVTLAGGEVKATNFVASFSIDSAVGQVTGTKHSTSFAIGIDCGTAGISLALLVNPAGFFPSAAYSAKIRTAVGAFADNGMFQLDLAGPGSFDETFRSSRPSADELVPRSKEDCERDRWRNFGGMFASQTECMAFVAHH